jgi:8-oxo-dGTP pyrophosphatase MutT (NUDIX family)
MDFDLFLNSIPKIQNQSLRGELSHQKLAPPERVELMANFDATNCRKAAVLMLFYPKKNKTHLALILRTTYNGVHSSQIALPGGKVENFDSNHQQTALRETHEEIGINPDKISVIRPFSEIYVPPSNFMVYPFLGFVSQELQFVLDANEVAGLVECPVSVLLDEASVVSMNMATSYSDMVSVPCFKIDNHYVWGATAMMLSELKDVLLDSF